MRLSILFIQHYYHPYIQLLPDRVILTEFHCNYLLKLYYLKDQIMFISKQDIHMGLMEQATDDKIHTRTISLSTYPAKNNCVIVEGILKDDRTVGIYLATGESKPPGTIHQMIIRMLVGPPGMTIQDVEVEMVDVPRDECFETKSGIDKLKGLQVKSGFTAKVKDLIGGNKGCAHMTTLVTSMGHEVIQGYYTFFANTNQHQSESTTSDAYKKGMNNFLEDTCHVWRKGGLLITKLKQGLQKNIE